VSELYIHLQELWQIHVRFQIKHKETFSSCSTLHVHAKISLSFPYSRHFLITKYLWPVDHESCHLTNEEQIIPLSISKYFG